MQLSPLLGRPSEQFVVVVDDEHLIRRVVVSQLGRLHVKNVVTLEDGDQLLSALDNAPRPPTCVLLDIVMRRSNGVSVLEELRRHPKWSTLSVYAMTSNVESEALFRASGFDGLMAKPFGREHLVTVLSHCLLSRDQRDSFVVAAKRRLTCT